MDFSNEVLSEMDLNYTHIDVEEYGLVKPRFDESMEFILKNVAHKILKMRKPQYYWKVLCAYPLATAQLVEYARRIKGDPTLRPPLELIYATELTQRQIVHLGNGGILDTIKQTDFAWKTTDIFRREKLNPPIHWLSEHGLITVRPLEKSDRHGTAMRVRITNKGIWVFDYLCVVLEKINIECMRESRSMELRVMNESMKRSRYGPCDKDE